LQIRQGYNLLEKAKYSPKSAKKAEKIFLLTPDHVGGNLSKCREINKFKSYLYIE
jgi:hypothetical protein